MVLNSNFWHQKLSLVRHLRYSTENQILSKLFEHWNNWPSLVQRSISPNHIEIKEQLEFDRKHVEVISSVFANDYKVRKHRHRFKFLLRLNTDCIWKMEKQLNAFSSSSQEWDMWSCLYLNWKPSHSIRIQKKELLLLKVLHGQNL